MGSSDAGFRPRTTRSFCFGKRTQNHWRPGVAPRGCLCPGPGYVGCGTRCAQTVLAPKQDSGPGRSHARRRRDKAFAVLVIPDPDRGSSVSCLCSCAISWRLIPAPLYFPPLCKGRSGGVEPTPENLAHSPVVVPPLDTGALPPLAPPYKGGEQPVHNAGLSRRRAWGQDGIAHAVQ